MEFPTVLICGTGDYATASAIRLFRAGFKLLLLGQSPYYDIHQNRTFTRAIFQGFRKIRGVTARTLSDAVSRNSLPLGASLQQFISFTIKNQEIPLVLLQDLKEHEKFAVDYVLRFDEELYAAFREHLNGNETTIAPGEVADAHYRLCTKPEFWGEVIYPFDDEEDFESKSSESVSSPVFVVRAPIEGMFEATVEVGQKIYEKEELGKINEIAIFAPSGGVVSGILNSGLIVGRGQAIVEISSPQNAGNARVLPSEAFSLAGGALEALLFDWNRKNV